MVLREVKFRPRNINDGIPPILPYNVWMRNCSAYGCGGGFNFQNIDGIIAENIKTRNTKNPFTVKGAKNVYLRGLDFQQ
jgi:hypothetical protein